ncbi:MAG: hypothetical protein LBS31_00525, partial [Candidatus Adiutrix sp.]|nr:hypothetical protein [Candidatus Adiutrix sp.]
CLALEQAGFDSEGRALFDLIFNKPVKLEEAAAHIAAESFDAARENAAAHQPAALEVTAVGGPGDEFGVVARARLQAQNGDKVRVSITGLRPADGQGLIEAQSHEKTVSNYFTIAGTNKGIEERYPWRPYFSIITRENIKFDDIEKFIRLEPPLDFALGERGGREIRIYADFSPSSPVKVTLLKGLPSEKGALDHDVSYEVAAPAGSQKLMFSGRGRYLSPKKPLLVKLAGRNVERVRLQAWRIHENNLPAIINMQDYDSETRARLAIQFSQNVLNRETDVNGPRGEVFERLLDLDQAFGGQAGGAYLLKVSPAAAREEVGADDGRRYYYDRYDYQDYYNHTERYLPVMISDLGLAAHALPGRVTVWLNSLSAAEPVSGGRIRFYDAANQVVAEGLTNGQGFFSADLDASQAVFVTAAKGDDLTYMTFGSSARRGFDDENDDYYYGDWRENGQAKWYGGDGGYVDVAAPAAGRAYLTRGYEAFIFMPRDIFKPGETVPFKVMTRDRDLLPPETPFPLLWEIYGPDGRVLSQGRAEMNRHGGLDFASELPFSARTGRYEAIVSLPEASRTLGRVEFAVEDFTPPRLAIDLKPEQKVYAGPNPVIKLAAEVKYLFGAPGANLAWELGAVISGDRFEAKGWEGFEFPDPSADFQTARLERTQSGRLDENGRGDIAFSPPLEAGRLPNRMRVSFSLGVEEDGGRWNHKNASATYFPRQVILGLKRPDNLAAKEPFAIEVAAVDPESKPAAAARLKVEVFQVMPRYYNSYRYGRAYRQSAEELVPRLAAEAPLTEGRGAAVFTPETAGLYEIKISEPESGLTVRRRVHVYGLIADAPSDETGARGEVLLSLDKAVYRPGDTAVVTVKAPFPGRLWLTLEDSGQLFSHSAEMVSTETEVRLPVAGSIKNNAYVTATVLRPVKEGQTTFRAIGVKSLEMDRELNRLTVTAEIAERLAPAAKARLKIKLADQAGRPAAGEATVALVDEGVLSLTGFRTPDPWRMFTVSRNLLTRFYDLYEQLLPLEEAVVPFLAPGGGDEAGGDGLFSPFRRKQEILSIFLASVEVGPDGEAETELDIPEYSGQGRLMVVASGRDRFGAAAKSLRLSRDLTAEATAPLALAPGDRFEIPVRFFLAEEAGTSAAGRGISVTASAEGPIRLTGPKSVAFDLAPGAALTHVFTAEARPEASAAEAVGPGRLVLR